MILYEPVDHFFLGHGKNKHLKCTVFHSVNLCIKNICKCQTLNAQAHTFLCTNPIIRFYTYKIFKKQNIQLFFASLFPSSHSRKSVPYEFSLNSSDSTVVFIQRRWTQYIGLFAFQYTRICTSLFFPQILHPGYFTELQGLALLSKPIKKEWRKAFFPAKHGHFWNNILRIHTSVLVSLNLECILSMQKCSNKRLN